jgi:hypothetical protein
MKVMLFCDAISREATFLNITATVLQITGFPISAQTVQSRMVGLLVNDEVEGVFLQTTSIILSENSRCPVRDFNGESTPSPATPFRSVVQYSSHNELPIIALQKKTQF